MNVKSNLYAKYYFELRELFKTCEYEFPARPLSRADEERLEITSVNFRDGIKFSQGGTIPKMANEDKDKDEEEPDPRGIP